MQLGRWCRGRVAGCSLPPQLHAHLLWGHGVQHALALALRSLGLSLWPGSRSAAGRRRYDAKSAARLRRPGPASLARQAELQPA